MSRRRLSGLPTVMAVITKSTKIASVLKLVKFTKILLTASSMAVSAVAYGFAYGPAFAIALMGMLFIHEMGHVIAMWRKGLRTSLPVFVPFLGAAIFADAFHDRETEAYVGYGGPLLGSIGALLCVGAWLLTGWPLLLLTGFLGVYLNLFNLIPIQPLDGGRIAQVVGTGIRYVGVALLIIFTLFLGEPALLLIWVFVMQEIRLPLYWRPVIAAVLVATMAALFWFDYSHQLWWIDILDVFVGSAFVWLYVAMERNRLWRLKHGLPERVDDDRPYPPAKTRYTWLAIYLTSTATLWVVMAYLLEQLADIAH